jgi:predicted enzyme related to lactoylglutathione lyase
MLVFGSTKQVDSAHSAMRACSSALYVITEDVDAIHARVVRADGNVVQAPQNTRFGSGASSYVFTAKDPEGNL